MTFLPFGMNDTLRESVLPSVDKGSGRLRCAVPIPNWSASQDKTANSIYYSFTCTSGT